jgi:hypothetical protein
MSTISSPTPQVDTAPHPQMPCRMPDANAFRRICDAGGAWGCVPVRKPLDDSSAAFARKFPAAQFTRTSSRPNRWTVVATAPWQSSQFRTSPWWPPGKRELGRTTWDVDTLPRQVPVTHLYGQGAYALALKELARILQDIVSTSEDRHRSSVQACNSSNGSGDSQEKSHRKAFSRPYNLPSCLVISSPMPDPPPVIRATCQSKNVMR